MEGKESETQADKHSKAKGKGQQPSEYSWRKVFSATRQGVSVRYWPNIIVTLVGVLLLTPLAGAIMRSPKTIVIGIAVGLILVICFGAYEIIQHIDSSPMPNPTPAPAPIVNELHGILLPANDPNPPNPCEARGPLPPAAISIFIGSCAAWTIDAHMVVWKWPN
jgi:hypothetical protein